MMIDQEALKELDDINELVTCSGVEVLLSEIHSSPKGEKAWPRLLMFFKVLLLQSRYGLTDPQLEKQLARDLLFRRFVHLDISESVPGQSTFWRFRQKLNQLNLMEYPLKAINHQLSEQGLYIQSGEVSIMDGMRCVCMCCWPFSNSNLG